MLLLGDVMVRSRLIVATLAATMALNAFAGVELVLVDGSHVAGAVVERRGDEYRVRTDDGAEIVIPIELVREIRLSGGDPTADGPSRGLPSALPPSLSPSPTEQLAASDRDPSSDGDPTVDRPSRGLPSAPPPGLSASLSPSLAEQLAAFGRDPSSFQAGPIDANWQYEDVLGYGTDVTQFGPSRWSRSPIDANWRYEDVLGYGTDVTRFAPSRWYRPPIRASWYPTDGWKSPLRESDDNPD